MAKEKIDPWVCEICAEEFRNEVDLLAHLFNGSCEREIKARHSEIDKRMLARKV